MNESNLDTIQTNSPSIEKGDKLLYNEGGMYLIETPHHQNIPKRTHLNYNFSDEELNFSWVKKPKPAKKINKNVTTREKQLRTPISNRQRPMTFLTQVQDSSKIHYATNDSKPKTPSPSQRRENTKTFMNLVGFEDNSQYSRPNTSLNKQRPQTSYKLAKPQTKKQKTGYSIERSPQISKRKPIDLSPYNKSPPSEEEINKIPPRLQSMIKEEPESIVFHAICGDTLKSLPREVTSKVLVELNKYLQKCISLNYIYESSFIDSCIQNIRNEKQSISRKKEIEELVNKIDDNEFYMTEQESKLKRNLMALEVEKELTLKNLELSYEEELRNLEEEWNSETIQSKFNKPSGQLIEMRYHAKLLLDAHKFEDAAALGKDIEALEQIETEAATKKLKFEYKKAGDRILEKYKHQCETIDGVYKKKEMKIRKESQVNMIPIQKKLDKLIAQKDDVMKNEIKRPKSRCTSTTRHTPISYIPDDTSDISIDAKLEVPPIIEVSS